MVSHRYRFIFVHIAKTGGTSVRRALARYKYRHPLDLLQVLTSRLSGMTRHRLGCKFPRHARLVAAHEMLPRELFAAYFKFTFVRNPWDLQVSSFHHLHREHPDLVKDLGDFSTFVRHKLDPDREPNYLLDLAAVVQSDCLKDVDGRYTADFIGKTENLQEDFNHVCERVGLSPFNLPHARKATDRKAYATYYNDAIRNLVARHYAEDIERFEYAF